MRISGIYTITNKINNKIYIGYSLNIYKRFYKHKYLLKNNKHNNIYLQSSWNKYGEENFEFEILEECSEEFLCSQEHYWCNMLNTHDKNFGFNNLPTNPNGRPFKYNNEIIMKMSLSHKGKPSHMLGKKHSQKTIEKLKNKPKRNQKKVYQYDLDGNFIKEWESITIAAKDLKIAKEHIGSCANNKRKSIGKFQWKFEKLEKIDKLKYNNDILKGELKHTSKLKLKEVLCIK